MSTVEVDLRLIFGGGAEKVERGRMKVTWSDVTDTGFRGETAFQGRSIKGQRHEDTGTEMSTVVEGYKMDGLFIVLKV